MQAFKISGSEGQHEEVRTDHLRRPLHRRHRILVIDCFIEEPLQDTSLIISKRDRKVMDRTLTFLVSGLGMNPASS